MSEGVVDLKPLSILLVEDSEEDAALLLLELRRSGYQVTWKRVQTEPALRHALETETWDAIVSDYSMPSFSAPAAFAVVRELGLDVPFIIVSGTVGEDAAVRAMKAGVSDYLLKGGLTRLAPALEREISETARRTRMRQQLQRSEEILVRSERMRALGEMAAGISHDLKNVLVNPLSLQIELVHRALARGAPEKAAGTLAEMKSVLGHGVDLIERLRDFSRQDPEAGGTEVDLDDIAGQALEIARARILPGLGRTPQLVLELGSPPRIRAVRAELLSALVNLIVNAIDAMRDGGSIMVRSGRDGDGSFLEVEDDGPGMPSEVAARVFEPFFTTKPEGTGIGLAMVYACMKRHGGDVVLDTEPGRGTRFRLRLPAGVA